MRHFLMSIDHLYEERQISLGWNILKYQVPSVWWRDVCTIKVSNYTIIYATEDGGAKKANTLKIGPIIIRRKHNNKESLVMF